jgi:2-amino-4-hydroxy-6-hydroxymethyldihydropteridine diphosphokinase
LIEFINKRNLVLIFIGLGANLPTEQFGPPRAALGGALFALEQSGIQVVRRSPWYESAPVPVSDHPWYINAVAEISTALTPHQLIGALLEIEAETGRVRSVVNAPRILDLDLLVYHKIVIPGTREEGIDATVPHPRMIDRAFVMLPLGDLAPDWSHPVSGKAAKDIISELPAGQVTRRLEDAGGYHGTEWPGPT